MYQLIRNKVELLSLNVKSNIEILLIIEINIMKPFLIANFYLKTSHSNLDLIGMNLEVTYLFLSPTISCI